MQATQAPPRIRIGLDHVVMAGAVVCLVVLVVLPVGSLVLGSLKGESGLSFEIIRIGAMTIGRATYEPGWRWSEHVGAATGKKYCIPTTR